MDLHQRANAVRNVSLYVVAPIVKTVLPGKCVDLTAEGPRMAIRVVVSRSGFGPIGLLECAQTPAETFWRC